MNSRFAGTWASEKGHMQCSLGKAAYAVGQVSQWLPPHFPS